MNVNLSQTFDNIIVVGDIHGDFMPLVNKINEQYKIENSLIIVAGDVGMGFHKDGYYLDMFKKMGTRLSKRNNTVFFVRGNHDDPTAWTNPVFEKHFQDGNSNVRLIRDYTVITVESVKGVHNILCVGGALSVDRTERTDGVNYWNDEPFVYDESKIENITGITDVITHSAPNFCEPILKTGIVNWMEVDENLEKDCEKERNDHTLLYNKLKEKNKLTSWHYGHMHFSNTTYIDDTKFRLLDIMEFGEL